MMQTVLGAILGELSVKNLQIMSDKLDCITLGAQVSDLGPLGPLVDVFLDLVILAHFHAFSMHFYVV